MQDLRPIVRLLQNQRWISGAEIGKITGYFGNDLEQAIATLKARGLPLECQGPDLMRALLYKPIIFEIIL